MEDLEAVPGRVVDVLGQIRRVLAGFEEHLRAGELVICGPVVPPLFLEPADRHLAFGLAGPGYVTVNLTEAQP